MILYVAAAIGLLMIVPLVVVAWVVELGERMRRRG